MVTGVALFAAARLLENYIFSKGILPESLAGWSGLGLLIIAASAVFFGPVCGMLCGIGAGLAVGLAGGILISRLRPILPFIS